MSTIAHTEPVTYPFNEPEGLELAEEYAAAQATGLIRVRLPYGEPAWLATRYADVKLVLGDRRFSRAAAADHDEPRLGAAQQTEGVLSMDPPEHTRLRKLVATAFTQRRVVRLRPRVRELAGELLDAMIAGGPPADLVENLALPLPVAVICELLGVPELDRPKFRMWSDALLSTSRQTLEEFQRNQEDFREYTRHLIRLRRAEPADDLMTALIQARDDADRLSELELVDLCGGLLVAGHETTATQIPNFLYVLLRRPDRWSALVADPALIPAAVEELTRFTPSGAGPLFARYALVDIEVGGQLVRAGEPVVVAPGTANRDVRRFAAPDELRFDRPENQHLGFGHGAHHCPGAQLARLELQEALLALTTKLPNIRIAGDIVWKSQMIVRGVQAMPVAW